MRPERSSQPTAAHMMASLADAFSVALSTPTSMEEATELAALDTRFGTQAPSFAAAPNTCGAAARGTNNVCCLLRRAGRGVRRLSRRRGARPLLAALPACACLIVFIGIDDER
jgi:hypothetical protein